MTTAYPVLELFLLAVLVGGVVVVVTTYRGLGGRRNVWWFVGLVWVTVSILRSRPWAGSSSSRSSRCGRSSEPWTAWRGAGYDGGWSAPDPQAPQWGC